jgi:very-short-patch-repair endonuclease
MNKNFVEWSRAKIPESILEFARSMRKIPTEAEDVLWQHLRNRKLNNWKFRRQQPLEGFIVDFYCDQLKLIVEVDGASHATKEQQQFDQFRTEYLQEFGHKVIRF